MIQLHMTFLDSNGKKHKWIPKHASERLTETQIRDNMVGFTELQIFRKGEVALFQGISGAKYVETTERPVFNNEFRVRNLLN